MSAISINPNFPCMVFMFSIPKYVGGSLPQCYTSCGGNFVNCPPNRHTPFCPLNTTGKIHNCPYDVLRHSWVKIGKYDTSVKMMSVALKNNIARKGGSIKFFAVGIQGGVSVAAYEIIKWNTVKVPVGKSPRWGFEGVLTPYAISLAGKSFQKQQGVHPNFWKMNGGQFIMGFDGAGSFLSIKPKAVKGAAIGWQPC